MGQKPLRISLLNIGVPESKSVAFEFWSQKLRFWTAFCIRNEDLAELTLLQGLILAGYESANIVMSQSLALRAAYHQRDIAQRHGGGRVAIG